RVLQNLVQEKVPVRNLRAIIEALIDGVRGSKDPLVLTEVVRQRLAVSICNSLSADRKTLHVLLLDPLIEERLLGVAAPAAAAGAESPRRTDPRLLDAVIGRIASAADLM